MLVQETLPTENQMELAALRAEQEASTVYGTPISAQLVWRTRQEFRYNRRYTNSVETRAFREGTIMPRDPENYSTRHYEDDETEFEHDWSPYDEHLRQAESHLETFQLLADMAPHNGIAIGQQAQNTLEFAMKALLEAHEAPYQGTHNIGHLLGNVRRAGPELRGCVRNRDQEGSSLLSIRWTMAT